MGRTQPGVCYRLYKESQFAGPAGSDAEEERLELVERTLRPYPQPTVEMAELSQVVLILKKFGVTQWHEFPFISPPNRQVRKSLLLSAKPLSSSFRSFLAELGRRGG